MVQGIGAVSQVSPKTLSASTEVVAAKPNFPNRLMRISDAINPPIFPVKMDFKEKNISVYAYQINFAYNNYIFAKRNKVKKMEIKKRKAQLG